MYPTNTQATLLMCTNIEGKKLRETKGCWFQSDYWWARVRQTMAPGKCPTVRLIVPFITMLTLDCPTLFYWRLTSDPSTIQPDYGFLVDSWAWSVPKNAKPKSQATIPSCAPTVKDTASVPGVPSLTYDSSNLTGDSVLTKSKIGKTSESSTSSSKRPKNSDLPGDIDFKIWCCVFVPTFMQWISQQDNPFKHNAKLGCSAMQKIWDSIFLEVPYMITQSCTVYGLVSHDFYPIIYSTSSHMIDHATCIWLLVQHHQLGSNCYYSSALQFPPWPEGLWW